MKENKNLDKAFLGHPKPLFSLSMVEVWERFSFYGIRPLLVLFMTAAIASGGLGLSKEYASAIAGIFGAFVYLAVLPGGWLADNYLGQRKAVFIGSIIIAFGHLSIALSYFVPAMFFMGLVFIVIGTGLFKTCASVMVGMLYEKDDPRRDSGFTIFYMGINLGAFVAPFITGFLQVQYGWHFGFGAGGIGMLIAIAVFQFCTVPNFEEFRDKVRLDETWDKPLKQNKNALYVILLSILAVVAIAFFIFSDSVSINPVTIAKNMVAVILTCALIYFIYLLFFSSLEAHEKKNLLFFIIFFFAAALFWSVFEQQYTSFNFFAETLTDRKAFGFEIPTVWFQTINAFFIVVLAPLMGAIWIFFANRNFEISSITKFALGLIGGAAGFAVMALASQSIIDNNGGVDSAMSAIEAGVGVLASPWWLVVSYLFLSLGELCLSPVGLSIMTKIAPNLIKSQVMGLWFIASSVGNAMAGLIGGEANSDNLGSLPDLLYKCVWILLIVAAILFIIKKFIKHDVA